MTGASPDRRNLQAAALVAQSQTRDGVTITLASLEFQADALVAQFRVEATNLPYRGSPQPSFVMTDDGGQAYTPHLLGQDGMGLPTRLDWHLTIGFTPLPGPEATILSIAVPTVSIAVWNHAESMPVPVGQVSGPWEFAVPLA